jgi:hypothetical protein
MIDLDFGPLALGGVIVVVFILPFLYSFFVDGYDKQSPPVRYKDQ